MATSKQFLAQVKAGDIAGAIQSVLHDMTQLKIVTRIVSNGDVGDIDSLPDSQKISTHINILEGTIETAVGSEFLSEGAYSTLADGHMHQVAAGCSSIRDNIDSLQTLLGLIEQTDWEDEATADAAIADTLSKDLSSELSPADVGEKVGDVGELEQDEDASTDAGQLQDAWSEPSVEGRQTEPGLTAVGVAAGAAAAGAAGLGLGLGDDAAEDSWGDLDSVAVADELPSDELPSAKDPSADELFADDLSGDVAVDDFLGEDSSAPEDVLSDNLFSDHDLSADSLPQDDASGDFLGLGADDTRDALDFSDEAAADLSDLDLGVEPESGDSLELGTMDLGTDLGAADPGDDLSSDSGDELTLGGGLRPGDDLDLGDDLALGDDLDLGDDLALGDDFSSDASDELTLGGGLRPGDDLDLGDDLALGDDLSGDFGEDDLSLGGNLRDDFGSDFGADLGINLNADPDTDLGGSLEGGFGEDLADDLSLGDDDLSLGDDDLSLGNDDLSLGDDDLSLGDDDLSLGDDDLSLSGDLGTNLPEFEDNLGADFDSVDLGSALDTGLGSELEAGLEADSAADSEFGLNNDDDLLQGLLHQPAVAKRVDEPTTDFLTTDLLTEDAGESTGFLGEPSLDAGLDFGGPDDFSDDPLAGMDLDDDFPTDFSASLESNGDFGGIDNFSLDGLDTENGAPSDFSDLKPEADDPFASLTENPMLGLDESLSSGAEFSLEELQIEDAAGDDLSPDPEMDALALESIDDFDSNLWDEASEESAVASPPTQRVSRSLESLFSADESQANFDVDGLNFDKNGTNEEASDPLSALFSDTSLDDLEALNRDRTALGSDLVDDHSFAENPFEIDSLENDPFADLMVDE